MPSQHPLKGHCNTAFTAVADRFAELLNASADSGAALCVYHRGQVIINLWGGVRDRDNSLPWEEDTLVNVFSATKALTATAILLLADRDQLELSAPVAEYWPAFAENGKAEIRIEQVLNHTAGLAAFGNKIPDDDLYDWSAMIAHVEAMIPNWLPGSRQGYHVFTFGWILGGLIEQVTGQMPGDFIANEICAPRNLDFHIGLAANDLPRCADVAPMTAAVPTNSNAGNNVAKPKLSAEDLTLIQKAFANPTSLTRGSNSSAWRTAQVPAANGHTTAAGLAGLYRYLLESDPDNGALLSAAMRPVCYRETSRAMDSILSTNMAYSQGFFLSGDAADTSFGRGPRCFGHPGAGGSIGFADPDHELAFAFVSRNLGPGLLLDHRVQALSDSIYTAL